MADDPKKSKCADVLSHPPTPEECEAPRERRRRVMCSAWQKHNKDGTKLGQAIHESAEEIKKACQVTK